MTNIRPLAELISLENPKPLVISHRGEWTKAPENSIEAMLIAADMGADMVELDVQRTTDGHLYLMHDDTTDRMTNRAGLTTSVQEDEFETLFLRQGEGGPSAPVTSVAVPTLRRTLEAARGKVHLNIDTKHRRDLEAVGDLVRDMDMADQVLIKMIVDPTRPDATIKDARWFKDLTFMPVMLEPRPGKMVEDALALTQFYDAQMLEISFLSLEELSEVSDVIRRKGVRLWCNTLDPVHPLDYSDTLALADPEGVWGTLLRHGIGAIQTDHVGNLKAYLQEAAAQDAIETTP